MATKKALIAEEIALIIVVSLEVSYYWIEQKFDIIQ